MFSCANLSRSLVFSSIEVFWGPYYEELSMLGQHVFNSLGQGYLLTISEMENSVIRSVLNED